MVFGVPDQNLVPLLDHIWGHLHAFARSGRLRNRWWYFGYPDQQVRIESVTTVSRGAHVAFHSAADFKKLLPVATSWLSIAVFTDGS